ncbi:MAG: hypothetical protein KIT80_07885 [Chitinophagaceae bacterium]|nr:hypothetical protein [Chitinophagaceae bacterium]MCW5926814.1 hypothetical protein [Chitinophagaceae bacterium]
MKTIITSLALLLVTGAATAQNDKYVKAMEARLAAMDTTQSTPGLRSLSDAFLRIAEAEKTEWLPYYYSALCLTSMGWIDPKTDMDVNAAKIKELCDKAAAIEDNGEIYAIRYMAATQQMLVDPQTRWGTYGAEAEAAIKKGAAIDPNNPRLIYLQGSALFNTPEQFGGGKERAKPVLEKALALFNAEDPKQFYPRWGKEMTEQMLQQIK